MSTAATTSAYLLSLNTPGALPPGTNPYLYVRDQYYAYLKPTPSSGFRARIIALLVLLSVQILVSFATFYVEHLAARRTNQRIWLINLVERGGGKYIVLNQKIVLLIGNMIIAPILIGELIGIYRTYIVHSSLGAWDGWRLAFFPIMFFIGWSVSCASAQALSVAKYKGDRRRFTPNATAMNLIYVIGAISGVATLTAFAVIAGHASGRKYRIQGELIGMFEAASSNHAAVDGTVDPVEWRRFVLVVSEFFQASVEAIGDMKPTLWAFAIAPLFMIAVNFSALGVFLMIHKQLKLTALDPSGQFSTSTGGQTTQEIQKNGVRREMQNWASVERRERLAYVRVQTIGTFVGHAVFNSLFAAAVIWIALGAGNTTQLAKWANQEAFFTIPIWLWATIPTIGVTWRFFSLSYLLWRWRRRSDEETRRGSVSCGVITVPEPEPTQIHFSGERRPTCISFGAQETKEGDPHCSGAYDTDNV